MGTGNTIPSSSKTSGGPEGGLPAGSSLAPPRGQGGMALGGVLLDVGQFWPASDRDLIPSCHQQLVQWRSG